jgi:hypothetical protein
VTDAPLYPAVRTHLRALTGDTLIMQHARGSLPDPTHGHCVDDVARALQVDLLHGRTLGWQAVRDDAHRCLAFLAEAFDDSRSAFRNFRSVDGAWSDDVGSEDCQGRAIHALGDVIADAADATSVAVAGDLLARALPGAGGIRAIRAVSSVALGCEAASRAGTSAAMDRMLGLMVDRLDRAFGPVVGSAWPWPESRVTYENALPARALIVTGRARGVPRVVQMGLDILEWLVGAQTAVSGHLSPIGNGWWLAGRAPARFDQQPIEATTLMVAAAAALDVTADLRWGQVMEMAYGWFLGRNDLGIPVADPDRGACHDGLTPRGVNRNQGAESTLMWLMAVEAMRRSRARHAPPNTARVPMPVAS